jgi:hypothetical protein
LDTNAPVPPRHTGNFSALDRLDGRQDGKLEAPVTREAVFGLMRRLAGDEPGIHDPSAGVTRKDVATLSKALDLSADEAALLEAATFPDGVATVTAKANDIEDLKEAFITDAFEGKTGKAPLAYLTGRFGMDPKGVTDLLKQLPDNQRLQLARTVMLALGGQSQTKLATAIFASLSLDTIRSLAETMRPTTVYDDDVQIVARCLDALPDGEQERYMKAVFATVDWSDDLLKMPPDNKKGAITFDTQRTVLDALQVHASRTHTREMGITYGLPLLETANHLNDPDNLLEEYAMRDMAYFKSNQPVVDVQIDTLSTRMMKASLQTDLAELLAADPVDFVDRMQRSGSDGKDLVKVLTGILRGNNKSALAALEKGFDKVLKQLAPPATAGQDSEAVRKGRAKAAFALGYLLGAANNAAQDASKQSFSLLRTLIVKGIGAIPTVGGSVPDSIKETVANYVAGDNDAFSRKDFFRHTAATMSRVLGSFDAQYSDQGNSGDNPYALKAAFKNGATDFGLVYDISKD